MIWNSNLRFNIDKPVYREAYEHLHGMDRKKYKFCNHVIAVAVNEYFRRQEQTKCDPYFETREREQKFVSDIVAAVGEAVKEAMPGFMATYIMEKSWGNIQPEHTSLHTSEADISYDDIDYTFAGE